MVKVKVSVKVRVKVMELEMNWEEFYNIFSTENLKMDLSLKDLKELLSTQTPSTEILHPFIIGRSYMIRTVTMIYTGFIVDVFDKELVLTNCHWIADTGRWNEFISDMKTNEHESYGDRNVIIGRGAILDACIVSKLPEGNK